MKGKLRLGKRSATLALTFLVAMIAMLTAVFAAGETIHFGVDGYSSGSAWDISAGKSLVVEANGLSTSAGGYRIRITLAKGMQPKSFIWSNSDSTKWPKETGVQGSALDMDNAALDFFDGGSATVTNGNTILEYRVTGGVSRINLTDKIVVVPNPNLVYTNDEIQDAITIELLDKNGNPIQGKSESIDVTIVGDKITNYSYAAKKFLPGQGEGTTEGVHLYDVSYSRRWTGTFVAPMPVGEVDVTLGLPNCVSGITQVIDNRTGHGTKIDPSNIVFSETDHTVTIKNYEIGADEKDDSVELSIYGTISSSAATGTYKADPTATVFAFKNLYDKSDVTYYDYSRLTNLSTYAVKITQSQSTIQFNASQASSLPQFPEGHYGPLGRSGGFFTSSAQDAQNLTWTFDDRLQVIGVYFPTETGSVNVTSVTLSNGDTYDGLNITIDGAYQNLIYVNVADLHSKNSDIPEDCFIKSITAYCGNFSAGFAATSWYGKPIGRFVTGIEAGGAQTIPFSLSVNDKYTEEMSVIYDPTMDVACTNIEDTFYSDAARTKNATSFRAGSIIYGSTRIGVGGNALIPTEEPRFYIVVPQDMYFNPDKVTAHDWVTTTNSARSIRDPQGFSVADETIKYNSGYVQDAEGNYYTCYEFYIPKTVISSFQNVAKSDYNGYGHSWYGGHHTSLIFDYQLEIADTAITKNLSIGDYLMAGKGNIKTRSFSSLCGINGTSTHVDTWDMDDNGNRSETSVAAAQTASITILDNMNITVSGYLTHGGGGNVVSPYDPGADGSNEVNVVEFLPDTNADYHVVISNTLVSIGEKCAVNAYIPIPKGTVSGTDYTPNNITDGPQSTARLYQFNDFQWPMSLRSQIANVDPNNFEILYYLDSVTVDADGKPSGTTTANPSAAELERTVLVEIRSKAKVKVPSGQFEFTIPLKVGVTETEATTANLNDKKNIFRPRYYREGGIGDLWVNGNYVAARLGASSIGGYVFHDYNGNGIWDKEDLQESHIKGESGVVSIELYSGDDLLATTTPDNDGKYSFTGADLESGKIGEGTYKIKFVRSDPSYIFTKNLAPTQKNYQVNSEAVASSDNSYAEATITLPYEGVLSGYQEFINAGLFQDSIGGGANGYSPDGIPDGCEARVDYIADSNGQIKDGEKTFEFFYKEDGDGGYLHTNHLPIDTVAPAVTPDPGYELDYWEDSILLEQNKEGIFHYDAAGDPSTPFIVTAYFKQMEGTYTVTYDANGFDATVPSPQVKLQGVDLTLSNEKVVINEITDKEFILWATEPDGSGTTYLRGDTYTKDADVTLYAQYILSPQIGGPLHYAFIHQYAGYTDEFVEFLWGNNGDTIVPVERAREGLYLDDVIPASLDYDFTLVQDNQIYYFRYLEITYTITFDTGGGTSIAPITAAPGTDVTAPADPTKDGYIFAGWDTPIPKTMPETDVTITAIWTEASPEYTIVFKDYDGTVLSSITGQEGTAISAPSIKNNRLGYRVVGWDADVPDTMPDEDMTITAVYAPIEYTIRYILNGGDVMGNPIKYTIESEAITLNNPTRPGYTFEGWTGTGVSAPTSGVVIPAGSTGNRDYTANWPEGSGKYKVEHYLADMEGNFSAPPDYTEELEGTIGEQTGAVGRSYAGFVAQDIVQAMINDSTDPANMTVIKVYYDRRSYNVTFVDEDGTTLKAAQSYKYGTAANDIEKPNDPSKAATAQYTYTFTGWSPAIANVTGNATYKATYIGTLNKYTIRFVNFDGTELQKSDYEYGTTPTYTGATPTRAADAQYTYTFDGWNETISAVTGEKTYTAKYSTTTNKYTVTWKNGDTVLETDENVPYGTVPTYNGTTPTKAADAQYTYTFTGWSPAITDVTGNITYTATYSSTVNKYNVTFVDDDGTTVLKAATAYDYNTPAASIEKPADPTKPETAEFTYTFAGWSPVISDVTGDVTYKATYTSTKRSYTITFKNGENVLQSGLVEYGVTPAYTGTTPTKDPTDAIEYEFSGWDPDVAAVTGDQTYNAIFNSSARKYTVTFYDDDGTTVLGGPTEYAYGTEVSSIVKPGDPSKASTAEYDYAFSGWTLTAGTAGETVTGNMAYTAAYTATKRKYTITFKNGEQVLQSGLVEYGETPAYAGGTPTKEADAQYTYQFAGWDPDVSEVTGDATYTAKFTNDVNSYTITWNNYDGTKLADVTKEYGEAVPAYSGATPTKPESEGATYSFKEWVLTGGTAGETVTGNMTYTASFNEIPKKFTITFLNYDDSVLEAKEWEYGTVPSYTGTPGKAGNDQYSYEFIGWNPNVAAVTGTATYKAEFNQVVNEYTIKWIDYDGTPIASETIEYGEPMPGHPADPEREATAQYEYEFVEWIPDAAPVGNTVTRNVTFTASYDSTTRSYGVKFIGDGGAILQEGAVEYGIVPEYTGATPTKDADDQYTYEFSGWDPALKAVEGPVTYRAKFTKSAIPTIEYTFTQGDDSTWKQEDGKGANFRVSRSIADETCFEHFVGIKVDGQDVSEDDYTAESGSVKLALKSDYIDSLSEGEHELTAVFDDGSASARFYVMKIAETSLEDDNDSDEAGSNPTVDTDKDGDLKTSPSVKTGDDSNLKLPIAMLIASIAALAGLAIRRKRV